MKCAFGWVVLLYLSVLAPAHADDPCPQLRLRAVSEEAATRIAAIACQENVAWFRAFIDADGRAGGQAVYEAESEALADGTTAWRKVADYWRDSGLPNGCNAGGDACRSHLIDTPWSAAFVSWVMRRARLPGFSSSARHLDYVRAAWRDDPDSPYRLADPQETPPTSGDLLCYVRDRRQVIGYPGLLSALDRQQALAMHCDIVVAAQPGELAWLVGGNVQQAVTLRMLRLDPQGYLTDLPRRTDGDAPATRMRRPNATSTGRTGWRC